MGTDAATGHPPSESAAPRRDDDLLGALIDRIADRVVERLEEQRKIDLIAQAVIRRVRLGAHFEEATEPPDQAS